MSNHKTMLAVMDEVNCEVAEREELIEAIAIALLTRKNLFILGDTGQAKSFAINEFRRRITGAHQFERLLSKQCDEEMLFGRIDLSSLIPGAVPQSILAADARYVAARAELLEVLQGLPAVPDDVETLAGVKMLSENLEVYQKAIALTQASEPRLVTTGKIPESHIVFVDEVFKANDGVLNSLLSALNERKYTNEGQTIDIPTISFFGASNEVPKFSNPEEQILKPLYDRFELKVVTQYVEERAARLTVLKNKQTGATGHITATIALDELYAMQAEVSDVAVPDTINELMDDILCELRGKGIHISDRKLFSYYPIAQAKAWLSGRDTVTPPDLMALRHYLWTEPTDREVINPTLDRMCNDPLKDKLDNILKMALESHDDFNASVTDIGGQDISPARRIGKLRGEFVKLYQTLMALKASAQNDAERGQIDTLVAELEQHSMAAHSTVAFTYAPLPELYDMSAA